MAPQPKYRPSMTAAQIAKIVSLCKLESPMSLESMTLIGTLAPFEAKIANAGILPSYTTKPKPSLMESLTGEVASTDSYILHGVPYDSKEDYWGACYALYAEDPNSLSLVEIKAAKEHMYIRELMSPEEITEFEESM